jgi:hypothetical protein
MVNYNICRRVFRIYVLWTRASALAGGAVVGVADFAAGASGSNLFGTAYYSGNAGLTNDGARGGLCSDRTYV